MHPHATDPPIGHSFIQRIMIVHLAHFRLIPHNESPKQQCACSSNVMTKETIVKSSTYGSEYTFYAN